MLTLAGQLAGTPYDSLRLIKFGMVRLNLVAVVSSDDYIFILVFDMTHLKTIKMAT